MSDKKDLEQIRELDACGLFCPEPVMLLHNKIRDMEAGELLRVIATDPSTSRDIPKFCIYLGHELVEQSEQDDTYVYLVRKKSE
jgi:tRNA 2-thiouridine synthesizing protein A